MRPGPELAQEELIAARVQGPNSHPFDSKSTLLLTGTIVQRGRMHEMETRAPFLKTSVVNTV